MRREERSAELGRCRASLALELGLEQLEVGQDAGERGAQLVRRVGHELALALERRLGLVARGVELAEHVLEGVREVSHLVVGLRLRQRDARVARAGDLPGRAGEAGDRSHRAAGDHEAAEEGEQRAAEDAEDQEQPDAVDGRGSRALRLRVLHVATGVAGSDGVEDAVSARRR